MICRLSNARVLCNDGGNRHKFGAVCPGSGENSSRARTAGAGVRNAFSPYLLENIQLRRAAHGDIMRPYQFGAT